MRTSEKVTRGVTSALGSCPATRVKTRGTAKVVRSQVDVKNWIHRAPSVDEARPSQCPWCGRASRPTGSRLGLHGHGRRERQVLGPPAPGAPPELRLVLVRRYLCTGCDASMTVVPREVLTQRLYSSAAIGMCMALFSVCAMSLSDVRALVSPFTTVGATASAGWSSMLRWVDAVRARRLFEAVRPMPPEWSRRRAAERIAMTLAACAPPSAAALDVVTAAFVGAHSQ